jgi:nitroalkane oxidase
MGMQRRRVQRIIADENFNPRAVMDDDFIKFDESMAAIDTVVDPLPRSREIM